MLELAPKLLSKVKELGDASKSDAGCVAAGYTEAPRRMGSERAQFHAVLMRPCSKAKGVTLANGTVAELVSWPQNSAHRTVQGNGNLRSARPTLGFSTLKPVIEFELKLAQADSPSSLSAARGKKRRRLKRTDRQARLKRSNFWLPWQQGTRHDQAWYSCSWRFSDGISAKVACSPLITGLLQLLVLAFVPWASMPLPQGTTPPTAAERNKIPSQRKQPRTPKPAVRKQGNHRLRI